MNLIFYANIDIEKYFVFWIYSASALSIYILKFSFFSFNMINVIMACLFEKVIFAL